jgi:hypothetical protein
VTRANSPVGSGKVAGRREKRPAARDDSLSWSSHFQAVALICRGATCPTAAKISLVVGTVLTLANQGAVLVAGDISAATWARVAVNYLVPFLVSSIAYLAPFRTTRLGTPETPRQQSSGDNDGR